MNHELYTKIRSNPKFNTYTVKIQSIDSTKTCKFKRFLCVNGSLAGEYIDQLEAESTGYVAYNRANYAHNQHTSIFVKL